MRRGCIASQERQCHGCHRIISDAQRYLAVTEENGVETDEGGTLTYYCVDCALEKGYAFYKEEKDEKTLTFF